MLNADPLFPGHVTEDSPALAGIAGPGRPACCSWPDVSQFYQQQRAARSTPGQTEVSTAFCATAQPRPTT